MRWPNPPMLNLSRYKHQAASVEEEEEEEEEKEGWVVTDNRLQSPLLVVTHPPPPLSRYKNHQAAFDAFVHETELILGRLPSSVLPDDYVYEQD